MENRRCIVPPVGDLVGQLDFRCEWCSKVYKSLASYQKHIQYTHNIPVGEHRWFNCFHCPCTECRYHQHGTGVQVFRHIGQLRRHYQQKHMSRPFSCAACQRRFPLESSLASHRCCQAKDGESSSSIVKSHVCTVCKKGYQRPSTLRRHIRSEHGSLKEQVHQKENAPTKQHRCLHCDHVFISKDTLELHVKSRHHQKIEDECFLLEMEQLVRGIEDGTVRDASLLKELASILPELRRLQESDTKTT
ncbi:gastrula zinc finger protein XlCGF17.1 [Drosophila takahashii]|uniref:gastrula zinc finger protein XlCGF17.1 n=1 Tax=Drosophila takahashii TaxID=29030 RepID=UPI0007E5F437|nr:zinc finger protein 423 [Drosophila takahashii]